MKNQTQKKFYLTNLEKIAVISRKSLIEEKQYEYGLIKRDLDFYLAKVCERLAIDPKEKVMLSDDNSFISLVPKEDKDGKPVENRPVRNSG